MKLTNLAVNQTARKHYAAGYDARELDAEE